MYYEDPETWKEAYQKTEGYVVEYDKEIPKRE